MNNNEPPAANTNVGLKSNERGKKKNQSSLFCKVLRSVFPTIPKGNSPKEKYIIVLLTNPFFPPKHFCSIHIHSQLTKVSSAYSNSFLSIGMSCLLPWEFLSSHLTLFPRTGHEDFGKLTHRLVNRIIFLLFPE